MMIIESLKSLFRKSRQKKEIPWNPTCKSGEDELLIDTSNSADNEKAHRVYTLTHKKGILTNSMITLSILPCLYLILSILVILVLLYLQKKEADDLITPRKITRVSIGSGKTHSYGYRLGYGYDDYDYASKIPSFFELPKINQTIFHIYTCLTSLSGFSIVMILFSVLKQRFKVPEYRDHSFKLYIMLFFGFTSNFLNFAKGFSPYLESLNIKTLASDINKDVKIELSQLLFIALIFFSILFSLYSISVLDLLRTNKEGLVSGSSYDHSYNNYNNFDSHNRHNSHIPPNLTNEDNWLIYKRVILTYLSVFTLVYILFTLQENQIDLFSGTFMQFYFDKHHKFVNTMFPYFMHIINAVLMFSFYFELKYVNLALSQNMEVDYLFDDSERHIY